MNPRLHEKQLADSSSHRAARAATALGILLVAAFALVGGGGPAQAAPARAPQALLSGSWSWPTSMGLNGDVLTIVKDGSGNIYAGGWFTDAGSDPDCDYIAKWTGSAWDCPAGFGLPALSHVEDIAFDNSGDLYVAGVFTDAGGDADCDYIAAWSGSAWECEAGIGLNAWTNDLLFDGSDNIYATGDFTDAGGDTDCDRVAKWTGSAWDCPTAMAITSGSGRVLAFDGTDLIVGGVFSNGGGNSNCDNIAKWTGSAYDCDFTLGLNGGVLDMVVSGDDIYIVGSFENAGSNVNCDYIAIGDGSTYDCPFAFGLSSVGRAIAIGPDGTLYAGGEFVNAGGDADADSAAFWNGYEWEWPGDMGFADRVFALLLDGASLYAGGTFTDGGDGAGGDDDDCDHICLLTISEASTPTPTGTSTNTPTPTETPTPTATPYSGVLFEDGFESGDFSAWSSVNTGSGNLAVCGGIGLEGLWAACAVSTNDKRKQLTDSTPDDETIYYASFLFDPNGVNISGGSDRIRIFQGRMDANFPFILLLRDNAGTGTFQLRLRLQTDAGPGNYVDSAWVDLPDVWHLISVDWGASTGPGNNDGFGAVLVDDLPFLNVTGVDNDTLVIRGIRLGITTRMDGITMTGTLFFDDFYSDNDGYPE